MNILTEFLIFGDFPVQELIALSGILPTDSWSKGDVIGKTNRRQTESCISIASKIEDKLDFSNQISEILQLIAPNIPDIMSLVEKGCTTQLSLVIYQSRGGHTFPAVNITPHQMSLLAKVSCTLDVDIV